MIGKVMVSTGLPRDPKLFALAAAARVSWPTALGHLVALWCDVMVQREGGVLEGWARGDIERLAGWKGKQGSFVGALESTGWLDTTDDGHLKIHDWEDHQGNIIEDRRLEARRKRIERAHKKGVHCEDCPDVCRTSAGRPTDVTRTSGGPVPSLPVPSLPVCGVRGQDATQPAHTLRLVEPTDEDIIAAVHRWDPTFAEHKIRSETTRAVRLGMSKAELLKQIQDKGERLLIWTIIDLYRDGKNGKPKPEPTRENAPAKGERAPVLMERREDVQKRQDDARARCDAILDEMDEDERRGLQQDAEAAADNGNVPASARALFVTTWMRTKVAKENGIEGL